ncbi:MAG: hypothetical protein AAF502_20065 [Bacteroidota bacterium]
MSNLRTNLEAISKKFNYKLNEFAPNKFSLDVALKLKDGSFRYQYVYVWEAPIGRDKKVCYYMNSRVGTYTPSVNLYNLMKEAAYGIYSMVAITTDKDKEGNPCETVIVQAAPNVSYTNLDLLNDVIFEVAANADLMEEKYFGGDRN